jgi:hypothetical protein
MSKQSIRELTYLHDGLTNCYRTLNYDPIQSLIPNLDRRADGALCPFRMDGPHQPTVR